MSRRIAEDVYVKVGKYPVKRNKPTKPVIVEYYDDKDDNSSLYEDSMYEDGLYEDIDDQIIYDEENNNYEDDEYENGYDVEDQSDIEYYGSDDDSYLGEVDSYDNNDLDYTGREDSAEQLGNWDDESSYEEDKNMLERKAHKGYVISEEDGREYKVQKSLFKRPSTYLIGLLLISTVSLGYMAMNGNSKGSNESNPVSNLVSKVPLLSKKEDKKDSFFSFNDGSKGNVTEESNEINKYLTEKYPTVETASVNGNEASITFKTVDYPISEDSTYNLITGEITNILYDLSKSGIKSYSFSSKANFEDSKGNVNEEDLIDLTYDESSVKGIDDWDKFIAESKVDSGNLYNKASKYNINLGIYNKLTDFSKGSLETNSK